MKTKTKTTKEITKLFNEMFPGTGTFAERLDKLTTNDKLKFIELVYGKEK